MVIRVKMQNGNFDMVNNITLNRLLMEKKIVKFYRAIDQAWCVIGKPGNFVRGNQPQKFDVRAVTEERRRQI